MRTRRTDTVPECGFANPPGSPQRLMAPDARKIAAGQMESPFGDRLLEYLLSNRTHLAANPRVIGVQE